MSDRKERWLLKALVEGGIAGIMAPIIVLVIVTAFSSQLQDQFREPTCDDPKDLHPVRASAVTASGPEHADEDGSYPADNAIDSNAGTAWVESVPGYGIGQSLTFTLPSGTDLQLICMVNGYARSADYYLDNARVRQLEVTTDAGVKDVVVADLPIDEISTFQSVDPPKGWFDVGRTGSVRLTIRSTGTVGGMNAPEDTAISEVEFWAR